MLFRKWCRIKDAWVGCSFLWFVVLLPSFAAPSLRYFHRVSPKPMQPVNDMKPASFPEEVEEVQKAAALQKTRRSCIRNVLFRPYCTLPPRLGYTNMLHSSECGTREVQVAVVLFLNV